MNLQTDPSLVYKKLHLAIRILYMILDTWVTKPRSQRNQPQVEYYQTELSQLSSFHQEASQGKQIQNSLSQ